MNPNQDPNAAPDAAVPQPGAEIPVTPAPELTPATPEVAPVAPVEPVATATPVIDPVAPVAEPIAQSAPVNPFTAAGTPVGTSAPVTPVAPVDPTAPASPFGAAVPAPGAPAPKQKNTKKIILLASIIGGVILIAVAAVIIFLALTSVSKQDYVDAGKQYNTVSRAYSSVGRIDTAYNSSSSSAEFDEDVAEVKGKIATLKTENEALGKLKAVKVGEGKKLYTEFDNKLNGYIAHSEGLIKTYEILVPKLTACQSSSASDAASVIAGLKACRDGLDSITDIPNAEYKAYLDKLKTQYTEMITVTESILAITNPYGSQYTEYRALATKMSDILNVMTADSKALNKSLDEKAKELDPKPAADALRKYLEEQQRK